MHIYVIFIQIQVVFDDDVYLLQVKQNQLTLVGFGQDVDAMRKQIYDYFVENAISFYESD